MAWTPRCAGEEVCADFERASRLEWLETNGLGGYASSTILGLNTRRYHGLLVAATRPPGGRMVLLSKIEEVLVVSDRRFDLSSNQYPGAIHPQGYRYLREFRLDPFPVFRYRVEGVELEKRVFLVHGENTVVIEYELHALGEARADACMLELHPLIAYRDHHGTAHANGDLDPSVRMFAGLAVLAPYPGQPELFLAHDAESVTVPGDWYFNFEYAEERARGLDYREDLFNPIALSFCLGDRGRATMVVSTQERSAEDAPRLRQNEMDRRAAIAASAPCSEPLVEALAAAADQFIVARGGRKTIIAGYPWFSDWGRDTMIALPGLTLTTKRYDLARSILEEYSARASQGMLPNRLADDGERADYNTADATLWFFEAIRAYRDATADEEFVRTVFPQLGEIIEWHLRGTRYGIRVDADGLLAAGEPGVQLTWMDAKVGDWVVTPRVGKPVEIQALWYNALRVMQDLCRRFGDSRQETRVGKIADLTRASFRTKFWNPETSSLFDVVSETGNDAAIRPNQIFAVSLPYGMPDAAQARQVVEIVQRELLTPMGLRTLSPASPGFRASYGGSVTERDSAYHQGTVWPWLLGPFVTAYLKVHERSEAARLQAKGWVEGFLPHLDEACLNQVSEIADAIPPHRPNGSLAQAWSVAELLRVAVEVYRT